MFQQGVVSSHPDLPLCKCCTIRSVLQEDPLLGWDICPWCKMAQGAYAANTRVVGKLSSSPSFSIEFEMATSFSSYAELDRAFILLQHGFLRTTDGTVDEEYKSPIYRSWSAFQQVLPVLESLSDLVNEQCGTHVHVSLPCKEQLRPLHAAVFEPLVRHLEDHQEQTAAFWGRMFNEYAHPLLKERFSCVNIHTRYNTLEFRLPRFRTAEQYGAVVRFCRSVTHTLTQHLQANIPSPEQLSTSILTCYQQALKQANLHIPTIC